MNEEEDQSDEEDDEISEYGSSNCLSEEYI